MRRPGPADEQNSLRLIGKAEKERDRLQAIHSSSTFSIRIGTPKDNNSLTSNCLPLPGAVGGSAIQSIASSTLGVWTWISKTEALRL
jgi:hypothetical protein